MNQLESLAVKFNLVVKGKNVMTPHILNYIAIPNGIVEISEGRGITNNKIFGVTVVENYTQNHDKSTLFHSEEEVIKYVNELKINKQQL